MNRTPEAADHPRTRKDLFRAAARWGLSDDAAPWFVYGEARSVTSHTSNDDEAARVYRVTTCFAAAARALLERLEAAND